jgi:hypothetical protein
MSTPRPPFPDDHDTITPMTEEERLWRLERMRVAIQEAIDDPRPSIPLEDVRKMLAEGRLYYEDYSTDLVK